MRKKLEEFEKDLGDVLVRLIVGVDTNPPAPNVMLYLRMEEEHKDSGATNEVTEIWLANAEFVRLGILLTLASSYFAGSLKARTKESEEEVASLLAHWKAIRLGMKKWLRE